MDFLTQNSQYRVNGVLVNEKIIPDGTVWKDATKAKITTVTLLASGWDSTTPTQTVTATGILADETKQLIQAMPAPASMSAIIDAGAYCSAQGENSLTFTCTTVPTEDIVFNVSFQDAEYV